MAKAKVTDKVEVFIPRAGAGEDSVYIVGVNGVMYNLPRGKKSLVPDYVAEEIRRSFAAEDKMYSDRAKLQALAK